MSDFITNVAKARETFIQKNDGLCPDVLYLGQTQWTQLNAEIGRMHPNTWLDFIKWQSNYDGYTFVLMGMKPFRVDRHNHFNVAREI